MVPAIHVIPAPEPHTRASLAFDRGTLLVHGPPGGIRFGGIVWDERVGACRAPASAYADVRDRFAREGGADEVMAGGPAPAPWAAIELRPYQEAALAAWEAVGRRGVVVLPTGAGKTRLALAAMARTGLRSICLVPTRVLLDQWRAEAARVYPDTVGCYGDGEREVAPVTVATFESAYRHMATLGNRFDLVVVDEAHHFGGGGREEALEMCAAPARLGLTATPPRAPAAAATLATLVGPTVFELGIGDLTGSFLADFDLIVMELALAPDERVAYEADLGAFREAHARFRAIAAGAGWSEFARAAARTPEGRAALDAFRRTRKLIAFTRAKSAAVGSLLRRHRESRLLVFTADNDTAYAIARAHLIMPLTCDIGRREREDALERFRRGELRALVSAQVLNEGIDVPEADVAIVVAGARGEREHVQRVGRLLRPAEGKRALVYELVARGTTEVRQARRRRDGLAARSPAES